MTEKKKWIFKKDENGTNRNKETADRKKKSEWMKRKKNEWIGIWKKKNRLKKEKERMNE